ncbi:polysaccharide deacetylase family protein [Alicyclobacillus curvatus]|nr:polysaccharide deacetylase family protein [Alicyclobacillus curvatus]
MRQLSPFQHGPERRRERPPHSQHVDWHSLYPTEVILSGPTDRKQVALTFDDGPDTLWTPLILSILDSYDVKAEFNCVGERIQQNPSMLDRIFQGGHDVENHSWNHPNFTKIPLSEARWQIEQTNSLIQQIMGVRPRFFRPPYGAINAEVIQMVVSLEMKILYWTVDSLDWSGLTRSQVISNVLGHAGPGSIILMHFAGGRGGSLEDTVQALPYIIQTLHREGYTFKTVSNLLSLAPYQSDTSRK